MTNRPILHGNPLEDALLQVATQGLLYVTALRMRTAETRNPDNPDLPTRFVEVHMELQDREEKVYLILGKDEVQGLADQFNALLDPNEGLWVEKAADEFDCTEAEEVPEEALEEFKSKLNLPQDGEFTYLNGEAHQHD